MCSTSEIPLNYCFPLPPAQNADKMIEALVAILVYKKKKIHVTPMTGHKTVKSLVLDDSEKSLQQLEYEIFIV